MPLLIKIVDTGPLPLSIFDSITTPLALSEYDAFKSRISDCNKILSLSLSKFVFFVAETSTNNVSPLNSSATSSYLIRSFLIFEIFLFGKSDLLIATIIGTFAAFAWFIASTVCGLIPSSAATTKTTISVIFEPLARISVKAAWPGVSINVISWLLFAFTW